LIVHRYCERRGRDSNPHALAGARVSTATRPAISGSRPFEWNRGELNPVAVLARHSSRPRAIPFSGDRRLRANRKAVPLARES